MSTVPLSTIPGHAPVLMGAFPEHMVRKKSIFTVSRLTMGGNAEDYEDRGLKRLPRYTLDGKG